MAETKLAEIDWAEVQRILEEHGWKLQDIQFTHEASGSYAEIELCLLADLPALKKIVEETLPRAMARCMKPVSGRIQ